MFQTCNLEKLYTLYSDIAFAASAVPLWSHLGSEPTFSNQHYPLPNPNKIMPNILWASKKIDSPSRQACIFKMNRLPIHQRCCKHLAEFTVCPLIHMCKLLAQRLCDLHQHQIKLRSGSLHKPTAAPLAHCIVAYWLGLNNCKEVSEFRCSRFTVSRKFSLDGPPLLWITAFSFLFL